MSRHYEAVSGVDGVRLRRHTSISAAHRLEDRPRARCVPGVEHLSILAPPVVPARRRRKSFRRA